MKIAFPEYPFIIRMGYVCMILISFAVLLTLTDKNKVEAIANTEENKRKLKNAGKIFAFLASASAVLGIIWGTNLFGLSLTHLGFHSIFMMTFLLAFLSLIMYTNASSQIKDAKAYDFEPDLFKTDKTFLYGAMGIVVIIVSLYAYFW